MNYEQKYKESLERAKKLCGQGSITESLGYVFPELKESEDKKIRKWLEELIEAMPDNSIEFKDLRRIDVLHWLEKQDEKKPQGKSALEAWKDMHFEVYQQANGNRHEPNYSDDTTKMFSLNDIDEIIEKIGEQNPYGQRKECSDCQFNYAGECKGSCQMKIDEQKHANKVEPKFKDGDWVVDEDDNRAYQIKCVIENVTSGKISYDLVGGGYFSSIKKNYHLWTIQDAKDGDVLVSTWKGCSYIYIFKKILENNIIISHIFYYPNNINAVDIGVINMANTPTIPATKEQRELLFEKITEAGYEWDADKKELKELSMR